MLDLVSPPWVPSIGWEKESSPAAGPNREEASREMGGGVLGYTPPLRVRCAKVESVRRGVFLVTFYPKETPGAFFFDNTLVIFWREW
jgi:hypothetical protein